MQENFGMGKHHEQLLSLFEGACFALIQWLVVTSLSEKLIKFGLQSSSMGGVWMLTVVQEALIQLPEPFIELLQEVGIVNKARDHFLLMPIFIDPPQAY